MKFLLLYYGLNKFLLNSYHRCLFLPSLQEKKTHLEGLLETHEKQYVNTPERFLCQHVLMLIIRRMVFILSK